MEWNGILVVNNIWLTEKCVKLTNTGFTIMIILQFKKKFFFISYLIYLVEKVSIKV